jgi:hypothetical protein
VTAGGDSHRWDRMEFFSSYLPGPDGPGMSYCRPSGAGVVGKHDVCCCNKVGPGVFAIAIVAVRSSFSRLTSAQATSSLSPRNRLTHPTWVCLGRPRQEYCRPSGAGVAGQHLAG